MARKLPDDGGAAQQPQAWDAWMNLSRYAGLAVRVLRALTRTKQEEIVHALKTELGVSVRQNYISKIERGKIGVSLDRLGVICKALRCTPSRLMRIAESIASNANRQEEELLRETYAEVTRQLMKKEGPTHSSQKQLLRAIQGEVQRRLSERGESNHAPRRKAATESGKSARR